MKSAAAMAILVKSRAKYGRRLTEKDYNNLLSCKTIQDITLYLKSNTHYQNELEGIKEASVHRGNLEKLLKSKIFADFANLCRFERSIGEHYFEYILLKGEVDELLHFFRYFNSGHPQDYLFSMPDFFNLHTEIDLVALSTARSFDDVLKVVKLTPFSELLIPFKPSDDKTIDFPGIEAVLDKYLYSRAIKIFSEKFSGKERDELISIAKIQAELDNIRKIYRAKLYYNMSPDSIRSLLNPESLHLKKKQMERMINGKAAEVLDILRFGKFKKLTENIPFTFIDDYTTRILFDYCRRKIRFSTFPAVVMASTIVLFEIEIENITNVIEGKRYGIDSETIRKLLVLI